MPTEPTKKPTVSPAELARLRERAAETRAKLAHKPGVGELLSPEELADAAPFYFELRACIAELKKAREAAGLTLAQIADKTGLAIETLSRLETGAITNPTWKTLGLYASAVGSREVFPQGKPTFAPVPQRKATPSVARETAMTPQFIRVVRKGEEILINVNSIWKIEVGYVVRQGNDLRRVRGKRGASNPEATRTYKLFVGADDYMLAADPDNPVLKVLETLYQQAVKA